MVIVYNSLRPRAVFFLVGPRTRIIAFKGSSLEPLFMESTRNTPRARLLG